MTIYVPRHDEGKMPIVMGSPLRTPSKYWNQWGIRYDYPDEMEALKSLGRMEYEREWGMGDSGQHDIISEASRIAFEGNDNNEILRELTGRVVAKHLEMQTRSGKREFYVLDVGAGDGRSADIMLDSLPRDFSGEVHMLLLDPSEKALEKAGERMKKRSIRYTLLKGMQNEMPNLLEHHGYRGMSAIMQVAAIHHDPSIPWDSFYKSLESDGVFVSGDWHPQLWQDPAYVLTMLERMEWDLKDEGIRHFRQVYGVAKYSLPTDAADKKACDDIINFWKAYKQGCEDSGIEHGYNSIWPLESHQDFRDYIGDMKKAGFNTEKSGYLNELLKEAGNITNPHQFYPDSTIIMETFGYKSPIE